MEFKTAAQQASYERVAGFMKELFGEQARAVPDAPMFGITNGSALIFVSVHPWGEDDASVQARAFVVRGPELRPDLLDYLLRENESLRLGGFGIDQDGDIVFRHTLRATECTKADLRALVSAVAWTADKYDDEIIAKWGGKRAADRD